MVVKPKKKKLRNNEIRVIQIDKKAIEELLWENLVESQDVYFDVNRIDPERICSMEWDQASGMLTYAVMPISYLLDGKKLNFAFLRKKIGITTQSLFQPNRYRCLEITDSMFLED